LDIERFNILNPAGEGLRAGRLTQIASQDADLIVGLTLSQDLGHVARTGTGNRLAPLIRFGKAAMMQVFDGDDDIGSRAKQNNPQGMPTLALGTTRIGCTRLWRCVGSTEQEICHGDSPCVFDF
jgi:hypothetical protein